MTEKFGSSVACFSVLLRDTLDEPHSSCLEKLRRNRAGELLTSTGKSEKDIAQLVDYNNATTFRRAFKQAKEFRPSGT